MTHLVSVHQAYWRNYLNNAAQALCGGVQMSENKLRETDASVQEFIDGVENKTRRNDAYVLLDLMKKVTGTEPKMWGTSIIGFGKSHYRYESGREGDEPRVGFSPRKANLAIYVLSRDQNNDDLLARLGKHKSGVACLYVNKLADIDLKVLEELIARSWKASFEASGASK